MGHERIFGGKLSPVVVGRDLRNWLTCFWRPYVLVVMRFEYLPHPSRSGGLCECEPTSTALSPPHIRRGRTNKSTKCFHRCEAVVTMCNRRDFHVFRRGEILDLPTIRAERRRRPNLWDSDACQSKSVLGDKDRCLISDLVRGISVIFVISSRYSISIPW